jgi:hypothetical protein
MLSSEKKLHDILKNEKNHQYYVKPNDAVIILFLQILVEFRFEKPELSWIDAR